MVAELRPTDWMPPTASSRSGSVGHNSATICWGRRRVSPKYLVQKCECCWTLSNYVKSLGAPPRCSEVFMEMFSIIMQHYHQAPNMIWLDACLSTHLSKTIYSPYKWWNLSLGLMNQMPSYPQQQEFMLWWCSLIWLNWNRVSLIWLILV